MSTRAFTVGFSTPPSNRLAFPAGCTHTTTPAFDSPLNTPACGTASPSPLPSQGGQMHADAVGELLLDGPFANFQVTGLGQLGADHDSQGRARNVPKIASVLASLGSNAFI